MKGIYTSVLKLCLRLFTKELIIYGVIGITGVSLDFLIYGLLVKSFGVDYQLANFISTSIGITHNFILNAFLNFKIKDRLLWRYLKFYAVGFTGMLIAAVLLHVMIEQMNYDELLSKALTIIVLFIIQYMLNKKFSFSSS
ncbi:MAG: GtrA family protein [Akkermansiaceae bacterium]